jgi:hypothetical protein
MTEQRSILDVMADLLANVPEPVARKLHLSEHGWRFLRHTYAKVIPPEAAAVMLTLPIVIDDDLTGGQWQIRENGEVTSDGDMAPPPEGMTVFYTPHSGWLAIRKDLAQMPASVSWTAL